MGQGEADEKPCPLCTKPTSQVWHVNSRVGSVCWKCKELFRAVLEDPPLNWRPAMAPTVLKNEVDQAAGDIELHPKYVPHRRSHIGHLSAWHEPPLFKQGLYRHYKGGIYHALFLAWAHDFGSTPEWAVVYVSLTKGTIFLRPLMNPAEDSWLDTILFKDLATERIVHEVPRFEFIGLPGASPKT